MAKTTGKKIASRTMTKPVCGKTCDWISKKQQDGK